MIAIGSLLVLSDPTQCARVLWRARANRQYAHCARRPTPRPPADGLRIAAYTYTTGSQRSSPLLVHDGLVPDCRSDFGVACFYFITTHVRYDAWAARGWRIRLLKPQRGTDFVSAERLTTKFYKFILPWELRGFDWVLSFDDNYSLRLDGLAQFVRTHSSSVLVLLSWRHWASNEKARTELGVSNYSGFAAFDWEAKSMLFHRPGYIGRSYDNCVEWLDRMHALVSSNSSSGLFDEYFDLSVLLQHVSHPLWHGHARLMLRQTFLESRRIERDQFLLPYFLWRTPAVHKATAVVEEDQLYSRLCRCVVWGTRFQSHRPNRTKQIQGVPHTQNHVPLHDDGGAFVCGLDVVNRGPCTDSRACPLISEHSRDPALSHRACEASCYHRPSCALFVTNSRGSCYLKREAVIDGPDLPTEGTRSCARASALQRLAHETCSCDPSRRRHHQQRPVVSSVLHGVYLGYAGDNLGDRLMFDAARCLFHCASSGRAALLPTASLDPQAPYAFVVLGGGSLLSANGNFEPMVAAFTSWCALRPWRCFVAGTGWDDTHLDVLPRKMLTRVPTSAAQAAHWQRWATNALTKRIPQLLPTAALNNWAALHRLMTSPSPATGNGTYLTGNGITRTCVASRVRGGVRGVLTSAAVRAAADHAPRLPEWLRSSPPEPSSIEATPRVLSSPSPSPRASVAVVAGDLGFAAPGLLKWPPSTVRPKQRTMASHSGGSLCLITGNSSDGEYAGRLAAEHAALAEFARRWWQRTGEPARFLSIFQSESADRLAAERLRDAAQASAAAMAPPPDTARASFASFGSAAHLSTTNELLQTLAVHCGLVVSHKLYGAIVSNALGLPTVAVTYRAKHVDFALSEMHATAAAQAEGWLLPPVARTGLLLETLVPMDGLSVSSLEEAAAAALRRKTSASYAVKPGASQVDEVRRASDVATRWWLEEAEGFVDTLDACDLATALKRDKTNDADEVNAGWKRHAKKNARGQVAAKAAASKAAKKVSLRFLGARRRHPFFLHR